MSADAPHGQHDHSKTEPAIREILRSLGLRATRLHRIESYSHSAWATDEVVVRYRIIGPTGRLTHEAAVAAHLPREALYPEVVASGCWGRDDWLVTVLIPGDPLLWSWPQMSTGHRATATQEAAAALRVIHRAPATHLRPPCLFGGAPVLARSDFVDALITLARRDDHDERLVEAVVANLESFRTVIDDDATIMAHHDFGFDQCIWRDGHVVGLVDLEMSHANTPDWDLPILLGACANPSESFGDEFGEALRRVDFVDVPRWFRDSYPEPFDHDALAQRLRIYELIYRFADLTADPDLAWMLNVLERGASYESLLP